jgi:hypothetical protein
LARTQRWVLAKRQRANGARKRVSNMWIVLANKWEGCERDGSRIDRKKSGVLLPSRALENTKWKNVSRRRSWQRNHRRLSPLPNVINSSGCIRQHILCIFLIRASTTFSVSMSLTRGLVFFARDGFCTMIDFAADNRRQSL